MKKICILSAVNIRHMSLVSLYTDLLRQNNMDFDLVYMDKYGEEEEFTCSKIYRYINITRKYQPKLFSIRILNIHKYLSFIPFAKKVIVENNYDFIIVWGEIAALLFADFLSSKYKGKYCLNIRDYCFNKIRYVNNRLVQAIDSAVFTTISSDGFRKFLPKRDYLMVHSLNTTVLKSCNPRNQLATDPISIGFVGYVRFFEVNRKILDIFKNDDRFKICFYGSMANVLKEYALKNNIRNVDFVDSFPVRKTAEYLSKIDLMNNLYGHGVISLDTALSIKLYHSVYNRIPVLVCPGTYGEEIVNQYHIGYVIKEYSENLKEKLYQWYKNLDFDYFDTGCKKFLDKINSDNQRFVDFFNTYIK